ncbi:hypothetical protein SprV_0200643600 [Sparganum proliferum]
MFRTLYIFLVIHIFRGCPTITPLVDQNPSNTTAWTLNSTCVGNSRKPLHLMATFFGGHDVSSDGKLLPSTQSTDTIYTGLVPSAVSAHDRASAVSLEIEVAESFFTFFDQCVIFVAIVDVVMIPVLLLVFFFIAKHFPIGKYL